MENRKIFERPIDVDPMQTIFNFIIYIFLPFW